MNGEKGYYWIDSLGGINSPVTYSRLQELHQQGLIFDETEICAVGDKSWSSYGTVPKSPKMVSQVNLNAYGNDARPDDLKKCHYCAETIPKDARVCIHCKEDLIIAQRSKTEGTIQVDLIACPGCRRPLSKHADRCPSCGHPIKRGFLGKAGAERAVNVTVLVIVIIAILSYMQSGGDSSSNRGSRESNFRIKPVVTMAEYRQIRNGMSYQQVVQVIGQTGEEVSRNHMDGVPGLMNSIETVMYQWVNPGGSNMNALFQNNKLVQKTQFDLR